MLKLIQLIPHLIFQQRVLLQMHRFDLIHQLMLSLLNMKLLNLLMNILMLMRHLSATLNLMLEYLLLLPHLLGVAGVELRLGHVLHSAASLMPPPNAASCACCAAK